uniref:3'-5' exonuclease domain-containing protein n=1 Tax=Spongospora subterranea TaxID=70186 RepID=A0A0H5R0Q9_9EUKA|eukprot:CRZ01364.1 hypothetical protein [Spongospora subterranea]
MRAWRRGTASMAGITIARCPETAKVAVDALVRIRDQHPDRYFACDTEVVDMDVKKQTPVGHGKVIAASIYAGDTADFGNGPRLFIDNLDDAAGTLDLFKPFFEDPKSPKAKFVI